MNGAVEPLNLDKQLDLTGIDRRSWEILDAYSLGGQAMAAIGAGLAEHRSNRDVNSLDCVVVHVIIL